ncbi:MAG: hypothetical protein SNI45_04045 [Rikenellaceae bacterium]
MIKVIIGGVECEVDSSTAISLSYDADQMIDLESCRTAKSITVKLPLSITNEALFGIEGDVHVESKFNSKGYQMALEVDGIEIFDGVAYLNQIVWGTDERYAVVECRGGVPLWVTLSAETLFSQLGLEYEERLTLTTIEESWSDDSSIKFFPILRDSYDITTTTGDSTGARLLRSIDDYHPFINLSTLLETIFGNAGYTMESTTATEESFDKIYISGNYSSAENEAARAALGFYAKRLSDTTTTTDSLGRVNVSPYEIYSTVGNIVDIESVESDSECYNYSSVLQYNGDAVVFRPTVQISAGFEYFLHYTCTCEIESRTKLKGIDTINLIDDGYIEWEITNRYEDHRDSPSGSINYTLCIFDFAEGDSFRLYGTNAAGAYVWVCDIDSRLTTVKLDSDFQSLSLYKVVGTNTITRYTDDWALYYGYVTGTAETEVEITVRSAPKDYSPTSPMEFEFILFTGAVSGAQFTLHKDSSVRPYFAEYPGYNSVITYEDVAQQSFDALDLLGALQHLFNLRFVTDEQAKTVRVESFDNFYNDSQYDWSDKIVEDQQIEFSDIALSKYRTNTLGYQQTDGVVQRMGESDNKYFGEWSFEVDSQAASTTDHTDLNPIFCASVNDDDGSIKVGDRDDLETVDSLSFSPRIVRYFRLADVEGETFQLPYAAFHAVDDDFTLCFEDRDGVTGLNRFYLNEVALYARSQVVTLSLKLSALDYSNLFAPNTGSASQRSIFIFTLRGESFRVILQSIESYDPSSGVARCTFLTID